MSQKSAAPLKEAAPPRMTLASVTRGKQREPMSLLVYGVEKIGKSTFASEAPSPIFLDAEKGTEEIDVARFPTPETWEDVLEAVRALASGEHTYRTLVLDTLDWIEPLLWAFICKRDGFPTIESYGFGKGYATALDEWRVLLAGLERLRIVRRMNVILLAHSWIKSFKNPEGLDFDRYELKLNPKAGGLLKEWPKAVLFANHETIATEEKKTKRVRGVATGARLIYTNRTAAYDAGNRYNLPDSLPLDWAEFAAAVDAGQSADPQVLIEEITRKAKEIGGEIEKQTAASLERVGSDAVKLAKLNSWVNSKHSAATAQKDG